MLITAMQVKRIENSGTKMRGIASITLDEMIAIHDIKILENNNNMFLAMPSRLTKANIFRDVAHPINSDVRGVLERLIFAAYEMAETMKCGCLELKLKEERQTVSFLDLNIECYSISKILAPIVHQTSDNGTNEYLEEKTTIETD